MKDRFSAELLKEGYVLSFDKPYAWTSFDLVNKVRYLLCRHAGIKKLKVGHAGTLDPLATGLLVLCTGKATRQIAAIQEQTKEYEAEFTFGATTPSCDRETEIDKTFAVEHLNEKIIMKTIPAFTGRIKQVPPLFSAKKLNGVRAYTLARKGIDKILEPREVEVLSFELMGFNENVLKSKIRCSKGTYIRSLARDFGEAVSSGAYLSSLRRTAIGEIKVGSAYDIENFERKLNFL
jgi:tRNA pseudouridine55 synthase